MIPSHNHFCRSLLRLVLASLLLCVLPTSQTLVREISVPRLWIVDQGGNGDFLDLPPAVSAASTGDTLLVRPGNYSGFLLNGKGLTIVGVDGQPRILGPSTVTGLAAGATSVLRSLEFRPSSAFNGVVPLSLVDNVGAVWLEGCQILDASWASPSGPATAALLEVLRSEAVSVARCFVGFTPPGPFANLLTQVDALAATDSAVWVFDSCLVGGSSQRFSTPLQGGHGARLVNSSFFASGTSFQGGQGSPALDNTFVGGCTPAGDGGVGLDASAAGGTTPILLACTLSGGLRGLPDRGCRGGADGAASAGALQIEPLPYRGVELSTPSPGAGNDLTLSAAGAPGDLVWTVSSFASDANYVPLYFGPRLTGALPLLTFEGTADGAGELTKVLSLPPLAALSFQRRFVQGLFFDGLGNAYLGSPTLLLVLP